MLFILGFILGAVFSVCLLFYLVRKYKDEIQKDELFYERVNL